SLFRMRKECFNAFLSELRVGSTACIPLQLPTLLHNWHSGHNGVVPSLCRGYGWPVWLGIVSSTALDAIVEMTLGSQFRGRQLARTGLFAPDTRQTPAQQRKGGALRCSIDRQTVAFHSGLLPFWKQASINKNLTETLKDVFHE